MKKFIEYLKDKKNPKRKAIIFFIGYFFFFVFVFISLGISISTSNTRDTIKYESGNGTSFKVGQLIDKNYLYIYTVTQDGVVYKYLGEKNGDYELFSFNDIKYYREKNNFYQENQGIWSDTTNPYVEPIFEEMDNIIKILGLSSYESKTSYESGQVKYNYLISTNTINQVFNNIDSDFLEEPNSIVISCDKNRNITSITFMLDSYCKLNNLCQNNLKIEIEFDKIGDVDTITSPVIKKD